MGSLLALLIIVFASLLIVRLGTNALMLTGVAQSAAVFQSASAFFGVGFTTAEAEMVVNHPVRRRIVLHLIIAGNIGLTSALATLILTFMSSEGKPTLHTLTMFGTLVLIALTTAVLLNLSFVKKPLDRLMQRSIEKVGMTKPLDFEMLLQLREGFCVSDVEIQEGHPLAGKMLMESRPADRGIIVLGIYHGGTKFEGAPDKSAKVEVGDVVMLYGEEKEVNAMALEKSVA